MKIAKIIIQIKNQLTRHKNNKITNNQHGKVLPIVLIFSILAQLAGGYFLTQAVTGKKLVWYEQIRIDSKYLSEASLQYLLAELSHNDNLRQSDNSINYTLDQIIGSDLNVGRTADMQITKSIIDVRIEPYYIAPEVVDIDNNSIAEDNEILVDDIAANNGDSIFDVESETNEDSESNADSETNADSESDEFFINNYAKIEVISKIRYNMLDFDVKHSFYAHINLDNMEIMQFKYINLGDNNDSLFGWDDGDR